MRGSHNQSHSQRLQQQCNLPARSGRSSRRQAGRPVAAYRQRGSRSGVNTFNAPVVWHEPSEGENIRFVVQEPGARYVHPVTVDEVIDRLNLMPLRLREGLEVVQFSRITRKRALFPCYGMQWGCAVYLYPIEKSLVETYARPPLPRQVIEARMYGGRWQQDGHEWKLIWTEKTIRDFYLNNVLIHEIGHVHDTWNNNYEARERYANWFAEEYGYRASRGRR